MPLDLIGGAGQLPEVEQDTSDDQPVIPEVPVLYPEDDEEFDEERAGEMPDEEVLPPIESDEEELIVSEWPDPAKSGG